MCHWEVVISELDFIRAAQSALADRYGGMWIEGDVYSVAVVKRTDADTALLANLAPVGVTVRVFDAKYSYAELTTFWERALQAVAKGGFQITSIGPMPQIGKVLVTVPSATIDIQAALSSTIPEDSFVVHSSGERFVATESG